MKPELVIFDADGVLIDSEIIGHRINAIEMTRLGFPLSIEKSIELLTGTTKNLFDKIMIQEFGKTMSESDLMSIVKKIDAEIAINLDAVLGISQVLDYLKQIKINKCIATNGGKEYVIQALKTTGLDGYFKPEEIFSVTMVNYKSKPAPDIFLLTADYFKVKPEACLVIEDGVLGIEAAKAANMPVIAFLGGSHARSPWYYHHLLKAGPIKMVDSSLELLETLKNYFEKQTTV